MPIPAAHANRLIYHFTHIDNLPGLLLTGFLANNHPKFPKGGHRSVAEKGIQQRRADLKVPCGLGGVVHDYVPLYFGSLSLMLLRVIHAKNIDQMDILYFEFPIDLLNTRDVVFTDASANTAEPDLPDFFGRLISGKMALQPKGRADEKEPIQRRADGGDLARGRPDIGRRGRQEEQGQRADDLGLAQAFRAVGAG